MCFFCYFILSESKFIQFFSLHTPSLLSAHMYSVSGTGWVYPVVFIVAHQKFHARKNTEQNECQTNHTGLEYKMHVY